MSTTMMMLGVTLKSFDQMTGGLRNAGKSIDGLRGKLNALRLEAEKLGRGALGDGLIAGGALLKPIEAFSDLEDASTRLKATMMDKNGMVGAFTQINDLAVKLGNKLPGTTADFVNMMQALKAQGISDESILGGVGTAAANLAVLLKMPSDEAAIFAAKMKVATGTVDNDMLGLMDTIQRLSFMGVTSTEMMYAFGRSGGALKTFKIQGLEASKALAPIFGMLIKGGLSGETIGTNFASILGNMADKKKVGSTNKLLAGSGIQLEFFDKAGNFKGVESMVAQLDKLKKLDPVKMNAALKELTGGGQDQQMLAQVITNGLDGYKKMVADMEQQANLQARVNAQLSTLKSLWEAATGTFTNALGAFAETFAPQIKTLTLYFGQLANRVQDFVKTHPELSKWVGIAIGGFAIAAVGLGALAIGFAGVLKYVALVSTLVPIAATAFKALGTAMMFAGRVALFLGKALMFTPIGRIITLIAGVAFVIYKYWGDIPRWVQNLWNGIVNTFKSAVKVISDLMPDWLKNSSSIQVNGLGSNRQNIAPINKNAQTLNGNLAITLHDNRAPSVKFNSNQSNLKTTMANGPLMVAH